MNDRLMTIVISCATTFVLMSVAQQVNWSPRQAAADVATDAPLKELDVDRLIVRRELIVSDTGQPWEPGFEKHQIARGLYARALIDGPRSAGLWVRGRLIKTEMDDPFDDRFHAINSDGSMFRMPAHISWNVWLGDAWRQLAIIEGETLENSEMPLEEWSGGNHPGRLRFQSFRPHHDEPLTDVIIGQGMMSVGGGGFGGEGLPYPREVLQLWGGTMQQTPVAAPKPPRVISDDGSGQRRYALIAIGPQGQRSEPSPEIIANGCATVAWDRVDGADSYIVLRDGQPTRPMRIEGNEKEWKDKPK